MEQPKLIARDKIIESVILQFHTAPNPRLIPILNAEQEQEQENKFVYSFNLFPNDPDYKFGTLQIKISDTPMVTHQQVLDANIDVSGSMEDICADGKTKMQHAKHTLKNIVTAISNSPSASVTMATYGFDDTVETVFQDTPVTEDTADELREKLDKLHPRGGTDIYKPLELQSKRVKMRLDKNPRLRHTNITLTDGQANQGNTKYTDMVEKVSSGCTNVFIGFGGDHNAVGLQKLADAQTNGSYFYIAEIEKAGLVFGEVIHQMLYTALTNITIRMDNAEIYDYKTNQWHKELAVASIVSEATKTYHVRSKTPQDANARIYACSTVHDEQDPSPISDDNPSLPPLISHETEEKTPVDLSIYMLRQRTQELIFNAHQHSIASVGTKNEYINHKELGKAIRKDLIDYHNFMKQYSIENGLETDEMLNTLITDVVVILKTFGGPRAAMYSLARGGSQGRQTSNNMSHIDPSDYAYYRRPMPLRRLNAGLFKTSLEIDVGDDDVDEFANLTDLAFPSQPTGIMRSNTTPKQIKMMRYTSSGSQIPELNEIDPIHHSISPKIPMKEENNETSQQEPTINL
jgi:von Willebrand factor type A domain